MSSKNIDTLARRDFLKYSSGALSLIYLGGCSSLDSSEPSVEPSGYPIDSTVLTTLQRRVKLSQTFSSIIVPKNLQNISEYDSKGYGVWSYDENVLSAPVRLDIMPTSYTKPVANESVRLLKFFAITDIHLIDKESPSQLMYLQPANVVGDKFGVDFEDKITSVYSPSMLYTTHVLDAVIQTVNALHKQDSIDFGISLGDTCNSTQYNETRWYIDVLDGKVITPSSGVHVGEKTIDYQKPYKAAGLDPEIPWYQAIGNHDHFWMGSIPPDEGNLRESYVSDEIIAMSNSLANAGKIYNMNPPLYYMGVLDGSTPRGDMIKAGPVTDFVSAPTVVPDVNRRSLTKAQWAQEFFNTTSSPVGHGFNLVPSGKQPDFACYSFIPKSELPIKVIVLDDTQREDDGDHSIHGRGFLDEDRWTWLKEELASGSSAGQLMIIACHVPIAVSPYANEDGSGDTFMDWYENSRTPSAKIENAVTLTDLITELHSHPNLLMWTAGHRHVNTVKAFVHDNAEQGFWQVETSSLFNFPQQMRLFDISLNSDYTISISVTNVDSAVKEGTPAWTARKYAVATQQIVKTVLNPNLIGADPRYPGVADPTIKTIDSNIGSYNAELLKQLNTKMKAKMRLLFPTI
ncbi:TIGR03768 family metallophosphoesterase [Sulfurimonas sp.]|uniref:TIGR03768 family metallophosphoesterase n=1 Tax=Sulfurimonas sp. TaxID=2022749 RepID=UPI002AB13B38|nr:TIGR03768 family metallophosphoesterase [Sulfurimonas sp.]